VSYYTQPKASGISSLTVVEVRNTKSVSLRQNQSVSKAASLQENHFHASSSF
jgi:hypothetical protein